MRLPLYTAASAAFAFALLAAPLPAEERVLFQDDFDRNESDEAKEELGNGWTTNSKSRAGGNKQVDLRDGTLHVYIHETADHGVSVRHDQLFRNGGVQLRFMLEHPKDTLGLDFADMQLKSVHAGHLFKVTVGTGKLEIMDSKTGIMSLPIREARMAGTLTPEQQKQLAAKKKTFPVKLNTNQRYALAVRIEGDEVSVTIDGTPAGTFASEGFAHPTKRALRIAIPREVVIDDLKITTTDPVEAKASKPA